MAELTFEAIGTGWRITADRLPERVQHSLAQRIADYDRQYSRFRTDSWVHSISQAAGTYDMPPDARPLFDLYHQLYDITGGLFTPMIGDTLEDAGYDAAYSLQPKERVRQPATWEASLRYAYPTLEVRQPTMLDFGAGGKGYLVDLLADILQASYIQNLCINAGGDIVCRGASQQVALEDPAFTGDAIGVAKIHNASLSGSAGNRRAWGNFHHIIDPESLQSPQHIAAVWVVAASGLLSDSLSTALFLVEPAKLTPHFSFEYAIVYADRSLVASQRFPGTFYS